MFSTKKAESEIKIEDFKSKYMDAGIHEDVAFKEAKTGTSVNGNTFIELRFEKDGQEAVHTEWSPNRKEGEGEMEFEARCTRQVKRIMQVMKCFFTQEELEFEANSFEQFANWVVTTMNQADKNKLIRLKLIYKGIYTSLPTYAKFTFAEPMTVSKEDSKIAKLSFDNFVKEEVKADVDPLVSNPLENKPTEVKTDDLPF